MTEVRRRPVIVFARSYIQFQTYCQWKKLDYSDREEAVPIYDSNKVAVEGLIELGLVPVHKDSVVILPGARALKTVLEKTIDKGGD